MDIFDKGLITILLGNAVIALASVPLVMRKVPRNPLYGFRTRAALKDDAAWYAANAYFGVRLVLGSILSAVVALFLHACQGLSPQVYLNVSVALLAAPGLIAAFLTFRFLRASHNREPGKDTAAPK